MFILMGCSNTAAHKDFNQPSTNGNLTSNIPAVNPEENDSTPSDIPTAPDSDSSPSDIPVTPSDIPEEPVSALSEILSEKYPDCTQVIIASVESYDATECEVMVLEQTDGKWVTVLTSVGYVGFKGSAPGEERKQNTLKTPLGIYKITSAMGIAQNPGTLFPYTQIKEGMYWGLNSDSPNYNRLVYEDPKGDRELLWKMGAQYNYVLNTSYNEEQIADKGGAIFIHASKGEPTAGCISIPEADMKSLIKWVDPEKCPVLFSCLTTDIPTL